MTDYPYGNGLYLYNMKTKQMDLREFPTTDEDAVQYIPQERAAQLLYDCHRKLGLSVIEAMIEVLKASLGITDDDINAQAIAAEEVQP